MWRRPFAHPPRLSPQLDCGKGWGNAEEQWYTAAPANVGVSGGALRITARAAAGNITSARLRTRLAGFSWQPTAELPTLRVSVRMKLPAGAGLWGSAWMLPSAGATAACSGCGAYGSWPASGEIDIASGVNGMASIQGNQHFGGTYPKDTHVESDASPLSGVSGAPACLPAADSGCACACLRTGQPRGQRCCAGPDQGAACIEQRTAPPGRAPVWTCPHPRSLAPATLLLSTPAGQLGWRLPHLLPGVVRRRHHAVEGGRRRRRRPPLLLGPVGARQRPGLALCWC